MADHTFCRLLAREVMNEVRKVTTAEQRKASYVIRTMVDMWEFHGPDGFYSYDRAHCAYDMKARGWNAYLRTIEVK